MAVSVLTRPYGFYRTITPVTIDSSFEQDDHITFRVDGGHGLTTGGFVYLKTNIGEYNGFFEVIAGDATTFLPNTISEDPQAIPFIKNITEGILYEIEATHTWNCVHLPIAYQLTNTLWPTNSADTTRTMSSVTNSNGYCALSLSGDIKATGSAATLEFVKITGATEDDLNGVWQIIAYTNDTTFTVNIPYSSANDTALTGASIQYYYNNYHIKVQVWGGLNNGHEYYAQKPYVLLATLDLIPDTDNNVKFSISEILKNQISIENDLLQGTLPNNLDAFTLYFIKYAEVYDDSDGTTLSQTTPSYTSDMSSHEGRAVNAELPFKNVFSGSMTDYVVGTNPTTGGSLLGSFLTNFEEPVLFSGQYFDLSFLWDGVLGIIFKQSWYLNGALQTSEYTDPIDSFYAGVYRKEFDADCSYDRVDVAAIPVSTWKMYAPNETVLGIAAWSNSVSFNSVSSTAFTLTPPTPLADNIGDVFGFANTINTLNVPTGSIVVIPNVVIVVTGSIEVSVRWLLTDLTLATDYGFQVQGYTAGTHTETFQITSLGSANRIRLTVTITSGAGTVTVTPPTSFYSFNPNEIISETKTLTIDCTCLKSKATGYYLSWLNNLGGFDYWYFTSYADKIINVVETGETKNNIFPSWPESYGEFADTIKKQTFRESNEQVLIRSQHLTEAQAEVLKSIRTSPLVQIVNSIYDRRTVIVDQDSFVSLPEGKNLHELSFTITYTDDVPSQRV